MLVSYQIIRLVRTTMDDDPSAENDWRSSSFLSTIIKAPGMLVQPINPAISTRVPGQPFFLYDSSTLMALGASLHDQLTTVHLKTVPHITRSPEFPYRERTGKDYCQVDQAILG